MSSRNGAVQTGNGRSRQLYRDDKLACKICLKPYDSFRRRPRALHCQHTFCEICICDSLLGLTETEIKNQRTIGEGAVITCPLCRARCQLNVLGVAGLLVDPIASSISQQAEKQQTQQGTLPDHRIGATRVSVVGQSRHAAAFSDVATVRPEKVERLHPVPSRDDVIEELPTDDVDGGQSVIVPQRSVRLHPAPDRQPIPGLSRRYVGFDDDDTDGGHLPGNTNSLRFKNTSSLISSHPPTTSFTLTRAGGSDGNLVDADRPLAAYVGRFGKLNVDGPTHRPGSFHRPSSIDCRAAADNHLVVVDRGSGSANPASTSRWPSSVQTFASNGDCLSTFVLDGAVAACFLVDGDRLAVAVDGGRVVVCDRSGRPEKTLPLGDGELVAVAPYRRDGFAVAQRDRLTICDRYRPTAVLRTIGGVSAGSRFRDIVDLCTTAGGGGGGALGAAWTLCVAESSVVYVLDADTGPARLLFVVGLSPEPFRPVGVAVDADSGDVLVADAAGRRVVRFGAGSDGRGGVRCLVELDAAAAGAAAADGSGPPENCGRIALGSPGPDGRRLLYVVVTGAGVAEVRMYRM